MSEISDVDFRTGNSVSLSLFLGLHRSNVVSPTPTVSETCRVSAACLIESDLDRDSTLRFVFGVGERRSPNFLLAARLIEEKRPSFSVGLSGADGDGMGAAAGAGPVGAVEGPGTGSGAGRGGFPSR